MTNQKYRNSCQLLPKVFVQGIVSGVLNSLAVGIIGTLLLKGYASTRTKSGSLRKEN